MGTSSATTALQCYADSVTNATSFQCSPTSECAASISIGGSATHTATAATTLPCAASPTSTSVHTSTTSRGTDFTIHGHLPTAMPAPQPVICPNFLDLSGMVGPCNQMQLGSLSLEPSSLPQPPQPPQALTAPQSLHIEGLKVELPPLSVLPKIGSLNLEQPNSTPFSMQGFVGDPMLALQPPNPMQFPGMGSSVGEAPPVAQNAAPNFALGQFDMSFAPGCTSFGTGVQNAGMVSPIPWC